MSASPQPVDALGPWLHLIPLVISALLWFALGRANRRLGWLRLGDLIFWDAIVLIVVFLAWLRYF